MRALTVTSKGAERAVLAEPNLGLIDPHRPFPENMIRDILLKIQQQGISPETAISSFITRVDSYFGFQPFSRSGTEGEEIVFRLHRETRTPSGVGCSCSQESRGKVQKDSSLVLAGSNIRGLVSSIRQQRTALITSDINWGIVTVQEWTQNFLRIEEDGSKKSMVVEMYNPVFVDFSSGDDRPKLVKANGRLRGILRDQIAAEEARMEIVTIAQANGYVEWRELTEAVRKGKERRAALRDLPELNKKRTELLELACLAQVYQLRHILLSGLAGEEVFSSGELLLLAGAVKNIPSQPLERVIGRRGLVEIIRWSGQQYNDSRSIQQMFESLGRTSCLVFNKRNNLCPFDSIPAS